MCEKNGQAILHPVERPQSWRQSEVFAELFRKEMIWMHTQRIANYQKSQRSDFIRSCPHWLPATAKQELHQRPVGICVEMNSCHQSCFVTGSRVHKLYLDRAREYQEFVASGHDAFELSLSGTVIHTEQGPSASDDSLRIAKLLPETS